MSDEVKEITGIEDLFINERNANLGTERGNWQIEESLRKYGAGPSVLADKNAKLIGGNHVTEMATQIGINKIRVVQTTGDELVVVQRTDLDLDEDLEAIELAYVLNRTSETNYYINTDIMLEDLNKGIDLSAYYMDEELELLLASDEPSFEEDTEDIPGPSEDEEDRWETIRITVSEQTAQQFETLMGYMPGESESEQFAHMLELVEQAVQAAE